MCLCINTYINKNSSHVIRFSLPFNAYNSKQFFLIVGHRMSIKLNNIFTTTVSKSLLCKRLFFSLDLGYFFPLNYSRTKQ